MTTRMPVRRTFALQRASAALAFISLAGVAVADITVYRCTQAGGSVLYADYPCKGGAIVDIQPGVANPGAVQHLERAGAAFDRAAAIRKASEENAAIRREELNQRRLETAAAQRAAEGASNPVEMYAPAYAVVVPRVKHRANHRNPVRHGSRKIPD
jgi:hypothetical protein